VTGIAIYIGIVGSFFVALFISSIPADLSDWSAFVGSIFGVSFAGLGAVYLVIGIVYLVMVYGLLKGMKWAWTITIILTVIVIAMYITAEITGSISNNSTIGSMDWISNNSIIVKIIQFVFGLIPTVGIIYYLYRPHVRSFF
jgi:hypothetical protein